MFTTVSTLHSNTGRFATQKPAEAEVVKQTQADFNTEDNSNSSRPQSRPQSRGMDTQDTVILTGASQDVSSAINRILEDVADSSEEEEEEEAVANEEPENKELKEVGREGDSVQGTAAPDLRSDPESDDEKAKEEGEGVKVSKKRKRRLISDSEGSEDEEKDAMNESEETWMKDIPILSPPKMVWFMIAARGSSLEGDPRAVSALVLVESDVERLPAAVVLGTILCPVPSILIW